MNKDEIWEKLKNDESTIYGEPIFDVFLKIIDELSPKHYKELSKDQKKHVQPDVRMICSTTAEDIKDAMKDGGEKTDGIILHHAKQGNLEIIKYLLTPDDYYTGLTHQAAIFSALYSKKDLIDYFFEGFKDDMLNTCVYHQNLNVIRYLIIEKKMKVQERLIITAVKTANLEIIKLILDNVRGYFVNDALIEICTDSAGEKTLKTAGYLIKKGASNLNSALSESAKHANIFLMKYLIAKGANNLNGALFSAVNNAANHPSKYFEVIKYLIESGANNLKEIYYLLKNNPSLNNIRIYVLKKIE